MAMRAVSPVSGSATRLDLHEGEIPARIGSRALSRPGIRSWRGVAV
jgi:hypothetical protein